MTDLFNRNWSLRVGTILIRANTLDIAFNVTKTKRREPNKAAIKIYNLNREHRDQIEESSEVNVTLEAGYNDDLSVIFSGNLRSGESVYTGNDVITSIEGEDGGTAYRRSILSRSFPAGTEVLTVLKAAVEGLGVGQGNLRDFSSINILEMGTTYPEGTVLNGPARDEVNRIVRSIRDTDSARTRYSWSIQNGNFQIRRGRRPVRDRAIKLTPQSGLLESPVRTRPDGRRPRFVSAKSLLIPGIFPGRIIVLESKFISGNFSVRRVSYKGDTSTNDWMCDMELEDY